MTDILPSFWLLVVVSYLIKESKRLTGLHMEEWFVYIMWVQWSNTPLLPYVSKISEPETERHAKSSAIFKLLPFPSHPRILYHKTRLSDCCPSVLCPPSCIPKLHFTVHIYYLSTPQPPISPLPFLHCYTLTVKWHRFTKCFLPLLVLVWKCIYMGKYICNMYACYEAKQADTHFCKWAGGWVTTNSI